MVSEAKKRANFKYRMKVIVTKRIDFNANTDSDILEFLNQSGEPTATLIKRLIREEIKRINK